MVSSYAVEESLCAILVGDECTIEIGDEALWHDASSEGYILISIDFGACACRVPYAYLVVYGILCSVTT